MLKLYENIRRYRKQAGMTQDELAKRAGYTDRSSIAKIEKGQVDLAQSKIEQFANIFEVSAGDLMGWEQEPEELADVAAQVLLNPATLAMVEQYLQLSESDQYAVRLLVASLAEKEKRTSESAGPEVTKTVSLLETE